MLFKKIYKTIFILGLSGLLFFSVSDFSIAIPKSATIEPRTSFSSYQNQKRRLSAQCLRFLQRFNSQFAVSEPSQVKKPRFGISISRPRILTPKSNLKENDLVSTENQSVASSIFSKAKQKVQIKIQKVQIKKQKVKLKIDFLSAKNKVNNGAIVVYGGQLVQGRSGVVAKASSSDFDNDQYWSDSNQPVSKKSIDQQKEESSDFANTQKEFKSLSPITEEIRNENSETPIDFSRTQMEILEAQEIKKKNSQKYELLQKKIDDKIRQFGRFKDPGNIYTEIKQRREAWAQFRKNLPYLEDVTFFPEITALRENIEVRDNTESSNFFSKIFYKVGFRGGSSENKLLTFLAEVVPDQNLDSLNFFGEITNKKALGSFLNFVGMNVKPKILNFYDY